MQPLLASFEDRIAEGNILDAGWIVDTELLVVDFRSLLDDSQRDIAPL